MRPFAPWALTDNYLDMRKMICSIVNRFSINGMSVDEVMSEADTAFLKANETYDPTIASYSTHVYSKVLNHLLEVRRRKMIDNQRMQITTIEYLDSQPAKHKPEFSIIEFIGDLNCDAGIAVALVLESPDNKGWKAMRRSDSPYAYKLALYNYLRRIGWSTKQVKEAFMEIRKALQ